MVLEKQDSGISLASTDGQDRKMSESDPRDLVKAQTLSKQDKQMGGSDTKLNVLREKSDLLEVGREEHAKSVAERVMHNDELRQMQWQR